MRMTGTAAALTLAGGVMGLVGTAAGATVTPRDTATTALERAAFVALPAIYEVRVPLRVEAIVTRGGQRLPIDQRITIRGTAYGVAPNRVVTALHLVNPPRERLLDELRATGRVDVTPDANTARVIVRLPTRVSLTRASAEGSAVDCAGRVPAPIEATVGRSATNPQDDLVLLEIADDTAPTLALDDNMPRQPVAAIGFGDQPSAVPAVRIGRLDAFGAIGDNDAFITTDIAVVRGDSGGPVIDAAGRSHGVVLRRRTDRSAPVIARATSVRRLLELDGHANVETQATVRFRAAMAQFWDRDYAAASAQLAPLTRTLRNSALATCIQSQAARLATARYVVSGPSRRRAAILALGAMAVLAAAFLGVLRVWRHPLD